MSRRWKMSMACLVLLIGLLGVKLMAWKALRIFPLTPQNTMEFFNVRVGLNVLSHLYPPVTFWILTRLSRVYAEDSVLSEAAAGKIILSFGMALLIFAQGPAFFFPGWLRSDLWFESDLWVLYNTFYAMGWCFLLAGMFRWPVVRSLLLYGRPGIAALVIGLAWYVAGPLRHEFAWDSVGWSIAAILSLFVALCGILSPNNIERIFAAGGLILMSVYSFYGGRFGGMAWFQIGLLADVRVIHPFLLIGLLAWTAVVLQVTNLFRRLGIRYDE
jgi:hypothetical protein